MDFGTQMNSTEWHLQILCHTVRMVSMNLFGNAVAILNHIVLNTYYGMPGDKLVCICPVSIP